MPRSILARSSSRFDRAIFRRLVARKAIVVVAGLIAGCDPASGDAGTS
jgi:hypothetical protein